MKSKRLWICLAGVGVIAAAGVLTYAFWPAKAPEPTGENSEQVVRFIASDAFAKLSDDKKQAYLQQAGREVFRQARENLSEEERERLRENVGRVFRQRMATRVDEYFELPAEQRTAYLDEMINRMPNRRRFVRPPGESSDRSSSDRPRRGRRFTPERLKRMIENTTPEQRAKFTQFMKDMRQRREELGLSSPHR